MLEKNNIGLDNPGIKISAIFDICFLLYWGRGKDRKGCQKKRDGAKFINTILYLCHEYIVFFIFYTPLTIL